MEPRNGVVVTSGRLIFAATLDEGKLCAYDQETGDVLWATDLPAASEGVPAVYEAGGRAYLVLPVCTVKGTNLPRDRSAIPQPLTHPVERSYIAFVLPPDSGSAK
jgi:glucose dehydrogenase